MGQHQASLDIGAACDSLVSLCGDTSHFLQKLVNDFLFPASRQVKEARDHSGGLNWLVSITVLSKHTNRTLSNCVECHLYLIGASLALAWSMGKCTAF